MHDLLQILLIVGQTIFVLWGIGAGFIIIKLIKIILKIESDVDDIYVVLNESLNTLDDSFKELTTISNYETFSDEPYVKRVVDSISGSRAAVVKIADKISSVFNIEDDDNDDDLDTEDDDIKTNL